MQVQAEAAELVDLRLCRQRRQSLRRRQADRVDLFHSEPAMHLRGRLVIFRSRRELLEVQMPPQEVLTSSPGHRTPGWAESCPSPEATVHKVAAQSMCEVVEPVQLNRVVA